MGEGVIVGPDDVGADEVGGGDRVGTGVGISSILQFGKKLKQFNPLGQSVLRPD